MIGNHGEAGHAHRRTGLVLPGAWLDSALARAAAGKEMCQLLGFDKLIVLEINAWKWFE